MTVEGRDEIIRQLQDLADELGRSPTLQDLKDSDESPSVYQVLRCFDSWNEAKEAARLKTYNKVGRDEMYTDAELIELLQDLDERVDGPVTRGDVDGSGDVPSRMAFRRHFGSWNQAKEAAGIEADTKHNQSYSDEELLAKLQELAEETDGPLTSSKLDDAEGYPSLATYVRRFGSWSEAVKKAGLGKDSAHPSNF
ncbi:MULTISPECIES: homing endonuclease associated repeat-containing protein [Haloferacaceae]|uniref:Homing endonuclease associated repeat-containing protein n=1 Tax=Halorubrum glutamatedens TaxID=2707018 RepID=A0ABD5QMJ5_9EURY|nr:hypothetical protein [Halobellus captivus]